MSGAPNYEPGDLIAATIDFKRAPIRKGRVFICEAVTTRLDKNGHCGVRLQGAPCQNPRSLGFFNADKFRKVDPLPPAMFSTEVDVDALLEETV